jgi:hypothetical protein
MTTSRARAPWDEGLSAIEIGRRLCITKNTVIGNVWDCAHREGQTIRQRPEITFPAWGGCFWPIGDLGSIGFHLCSHCPGPYCEAHCCCG